MKVDFKRNRNVISRVDFSKRDKTPVEEILDGMAARREKAWLRKAGRTRKALGASNSWVEL